MLCARLIPEGLPFIISFLGGAAGLPFNTGGLGAKCGFLLEGLAGRLLLLGVTSVDSNTVKLALLLAFRCNVLEFACNVLIFGGCGEVGVCCGLPSLCNTLVFTCKPFELPFLEWYGCLPEFCKFSVLCCFTRIEFR